MLSEWVTQANALAQEAEASGILVTGDQIDHIGIKCLTPEQFENLGQELSVTASSLGTVEINGRPITTFRLEESFQVIGQDVDILELAAPKSSERAGKKVEGFDHIEVVISESFTERRSRLPQANWADIRWPSVINPELCLRLEGGSIKFHHRSLESVIEIEHQLPEILDIKVPQPNDYQTWIFELNEGPWTSLAALEELFDQVQNSGIKTVLWNSSLDDFEQTIRDAEISELSPPKTLMLGRSDLAQRTAELNGLNFIQVPSFRD